jgi:tRNA pseudouridine55 synthase
MATDKRYRTAIDLTAFTATDDREGDRTEVAVATPPDEAAVQAALARFTGTIQQRPPAFSAMKVGGRRAYAAARKGTPMELAPRPVRVDAIELVEFRFPIVTLDIRCGKGFYVRSLARDLGVALGTGGHCASIRRTAVGPFTLDEARPLDALPQRLAAADLLPLEAALARLG